MFLLLCFCLFVPISTSLYLLRESSRQPGSFVLTMIGNQRIHNFHVEAVSARSIVDYHLFIHHTLRWFDTERGRRRWGKSSRTTASNNNNPSMNVSQGISYSESMSFDVESGNVAILCNNLHATSKSHCPACTTSRQWACLISLA